MTVDIATLGIRIDSSDARTAARDMDGMQQAGRRAEASVSALESVTRKLQAALAFLGVGTGVAAIIKMSDEYAKLTAQLRLATDSQRAYAIAYGDVKRIANDAQQDLAATGMLYARVAKATAELGTTQKSVAAITETISLAMKVSGANANESAAAQLQLAQAFASGALRGDEFNSVNEAAPRLMKALADGIGVPVGALRAMAAEGKITSQIMADVLPRALDKLQEEAKQVQTIGGAFTVLKNNVMEFTGVQAQASGFVSVFTGAIGLLANNLNVLVGVIATVAVAKMAASFSQWATGAYASVAANRALLASNLAAAEANVVATAAAHATAAARERELRASVLAAEGVVALAIAENGLIPAQARATAAAAAHTAALSAQSAAAGAASVGSGLLRGAMGLLGGPIGAVVTVLGVAATAWSWYSSKSHEANAKTPEETKASTAEVIAQMTRQIEVMERRNKMALAGVPTTKKETPLDTQMASVVAEIEKVGKQQGEYTNLTLEARQDILKKLGGQYGELTALIERFNKASADGAGNSAVAKAMQDIRERMTGVGDQYFKDLTTYQEALSDGVIGLDEYKRAVTALATETYKKSAAGKDSIATTNKETEAYATLIGSLREKSAANEYEIRTGRAMTESQKAVIKFDEEIKDGKLKLIPAHEREARALLARIAAQDAYLASAKATKAAIESLNDDRNSAYASAVAEADANAQLVKTFGMTKAQIEALTAARLEDRLAQRQALDLSEEEVAQTERMIAVKKRSAEALSNVDALTYTKQLAEENRKFAAESILNEQERAQALVGIEAEIWRKRIDLVAAGSAERQKIEQEYSIWYANQQAKPLIDEQRKAVEKYGDIFRTGFADMLNNGKAGWSSFTKSLTTTFKTSVADQIYKMFAQPFVVKMVASLLGVTGTGVATAAQAAGSGTGLVGIAQTASNLYKAITGGLNGLTSTIGTGLANLGTMLSSSGLQGFGMGVQGTAGMSSEGAAYLAQNVPGFSAGAAAAPWLGAAAGYGIGSTLNSAISGQYQTGSGVQTVEKIATAVASYFGGPLGGAIAGAISGLVNRTFGMGAKTQTASGIYGELGPGGASVSTYSKWAQKGGLLRSDKSGIDTATADMDTVTSLGNTYKAIIGASREYAEALGVNAEYISSRSQIFDIQLGKDAAANEKAIGTFFAGVADAVAGELVPGLAKFSKEGEAASATLQRLATNYAGLDVVLSTIGLKFGAVGVDSIAARERLIELSGGLQQLSTNVQGFAQNYLTESERLTPVAKAVGDALAGLGLSGVDTRDEFKNVVLGLDLTTEAGAKQYAAMMQLQDAFAQVHPAIEATASALRSAADIAAERADLQQQYDQAFLSDKEKERAAIAATNLDLYDSLQVRLAEKAAIDAAAQAAADAAYAIAKAQADAAASLAAINKSYDEQIAAVLKARMSEADQLALERAGLDATTQSKFDYLNALKAEDAATKANADAAIAAAAAIAKAQAEANAVQVKLMDDYLAASAAAYQKQLADQQAVASQYAAKETELYNLTHTEAEQLARARQLELDAMPATIAALQLQINAQKDLADAATKAANEIQAAAQKAAAIASERAGIQRDVLQIKGDTAGLRALELAALDPANRAAKQAYYDLQDKMAADQAASAAAQAWAQAQSNAAQSSIQAAEALKSAWKSATDSIFDEVARIRGLDPANGAQTYAGAQSAFAIATAQARAGDQEAAKLLPSLSKSMLDLAEANAVTAFDLRLARAQAAASLYQTGSMIGGQYGIKVPGFATGGDHMGGWRVVGENGPELEATGPARIFNANQTASMLGGDNSALLAEMRLLRAEVAELRRSNSNENLAIAKNTGKTADGIDGAVNGQRPLATKEIA